MKTCILEGVLLCVLLATVPFAAASSFAGVPAASAPPEWHYALYGNALSGWGFTPATTSTPGPILVVTTGDVLSLKLVSADAATHTWFVDENNDSSLQPTEPHSGSITNAGPVWFNFTVVLPPNTYTYRCGIHPATMWGELVVQAAPTFTLWGSAGAPNGWGLTNNSISYPGPTLNVRLGQTATIDLFSADGADHTFYVDFAASGSATGNTVSPVFNGSHTVRFTFVANAAGNFTYACGIHGPASMKGLLVVSGGPTGTPAIPDYTVYAAAIVAVMIIAIASVVLIRRRPNVPPGRPPGEPPR